MANGLGGWRPRSKSSGAATTATGSVDVIRQPMAQIRSAKVQGPRRELLRTTDLTGALPQPARPSLPAVHFVYASMSEHDRLGGGEKCEFVAGVARQGRRSDAVELWMKSFGGAGNFTLNRHGCCWCGSNNSIHP